MDGKVGFYLDFNCAIHPVAKKSEPDEEIMIKNVCEYLLYLINKLVEHNIEIEYVYIAIDGKAPNAKMKQQRLRRFKVGGDGSSDRSGSGSGSSGEIDFNMISPQTKFMDKLEKELQKFITYVATTLFTFPVILSGSSVAGEGEHKIIKHINENNGKGLNYIVYGLDSDLIFLCLLQLQKEKKTHIQLLREEILVKDKKDVDNKKNMENMKNMEKKDEPKLCLFDINTYNYVLKNEFSIKNIFDYIFISFLMGNDFLPPFEALKINEGGIDIVIEELKRQYEKKPDDESFFIESDNIHIKWENVNLFLEILSKKEKEQLKAQKKKRDMRIKQYTVNKNEEDRKEGYIEQKSSEIDFNPFGEEYRTEYYKYLFKRDSHDEVDFCQFLNLLKKNYFNGLQWIWEYYYNSTESDKLKNWFYKEESTPLLIDMKRDRDMRKDEDEDENKNEVKDNDKKDAVENILLHILPRSSVNLITDEKQKILMTNDRSYLSPYFPIQFEYEIFGKQYLWQCHPKIPHYTFTL